MAYSLQKKIRYNFKRDRFFALNDFIQVRILRHINDTMLAKTETIKEHE